MEAVEKPPRISKTKFTKVTRYCLCGLLLFFFAISLLLLQNTQQRYSLLANFSAEEQFVSSMQVLYKEEKTTINPARIERKSSTLRWDQQKIDDFVTNVLGYETFPDQCKGPVNRTTEHQILQQDLRMYGPFPFLPNFRNPCWRQPTTQRLSCLPYFYLAGFPKCGTTDMYSRITKHPSVAKAGKEPHWITRARFRASRSSLYFYAELYASHLVKSKNSYLAIVGDGSASTAWDNHAWRNVSDNKHCLEPQIINADFIRHLNPDTKIIVLVRNPTKRLYSDYMYFGKEIKSQQKFHKLAIQTIAMFNDCLKNNTLRNCAYSLGDDLKLRLHIGLYSVYIEDWLLRFPRDQLLVLRTEDTFSDVSGVMQTIFKFLKLEPPETQSFRKMLTNETRNVGSRAKKKGPMYETTQQMLDNFYRPFNRRLALILQDNKFTWEDV